jgi:VCBS repeat-containing protein
MKVLEPRIMFDGAAIFSGLDALDNLEAQKNNLDQTDISQQSLDNNQSLFSANVSTSKDFVFIDKGVNDYESLVHSIGSSKQIYIIDSNKDGFIEIQNILQGKSNLDSVHLIGHGSAGQIIFGNTTLSSENLNQYTDALRVIGSALTTSGDILFYGCNIAQTETGELLIQQIGNITQADIAASTDLTGKNGDWDLEHKIGSIESESLVFEEFNGTLDSYGVDSINSNVVAIHSATNFKATWSSGSGNNGGQTDPSSDRFIITMERQNITNSGGTLVFDQAGTNSTYTASSTNKINSYLIYSNDNTRGSTSRRTASRAGSVTFDNDILGYYTAWTSTIDNDYLDKSGATYPSTSASKVSKRAFEDFRTYQNTSTDWAYLTGDKTITFGSWNGYKGDFIRVITKATPTNTAPVASYDYAVINEDASFSVSDGAGENKVGYYDSSGENTGDILDSDNSSYDDTDADGDSLTITSVRIGRVENSGTAGTLGQALTGTYGQLTLNANGSYSYSANQNAADTLDSGDSVYDYFNYTVSDGTDTDSAVIRIQVKGINDDITAVNDFDAVNEDATITRSASSSYSVDYDDTDADGDDNYTNFTITAIKTGSTEGSGTAGTVGSALTGTYGTLTLNADGSYSYVADQSAADDLDSGDTAYDYFNYTVSDGTDTDIAVLRITVTGINDAPVAQNDVGVINEDATLTVSNSANANVSGSYDATGEHSGDVINTSSSSHTDSDPDDSASLVVSAIRTGGTEGSGTAGSIGSALTGTYGQLTIAANGSYSYVANQSAADDLDAGDSATDVFNYTLSDGTATDIGTITITVLGLNDPVVAVNDTGSVNEDATLTVSDGSGDIIANNDTDADDSASLVVSAIRLGGTEGSGTAGTLGQALTGTYGQLTLNANGSYTYVANQAAADDLDAGDTATDVFNYTLSDGTTTDIATITITVTGINDPVVATNDTGSVNEDATLTVSDGSGDIIANNDTDADDSASLVVSAIRTGGTEGSGTAGTLGQALTGTYGQLTLNANGSYTYVANQAAADALDANDTATDVFNYTLSDGTATDIATITITVTGINDAPVATNDTGSVNEDATLTVSDGSGDIIANNDTDADDSASLVVSAIRLGGTEGSGTAGTVGSALTGTYGQLTLNANGSYTYVANQAAADDLDAGDTATDVFNYTLSDGTTTDIATITITVTGINDPVVATNDTGSVNEDATLTVSDGSGDIIANNDTDADDGASLSVSSFRVGSTEGSGTAGTLGQALTGTYGQLTLNANGSYTYVANQAAADALDANDTATDVFNYTVTDGTSSDTATITITVTGINDPVVAANDTGSVNEDATLTVSDGSGDIIANNDTDADDSASLVVSAIRLGGTEGSGSAGTVGQALTGTYGQLTLNANGSYTYVANQAAADDLDAGDTATDVFNYTLSDGTATDIATITITVTGINDAPVAQNDVGVINEDATLTVSNSANANVSGSYDATGEHSGDVINTSSSSHTDSDPDDSASLVVSAIRLGSSESSGTAGTLGSALTGTYGTLTMNANGSYTYVADQAAADNLNAGQSATDSFNYTLSDGTATDIGVIQITVLGLNNDSSNAAPSATNDTDAVNANETITRSDGSSQDVQRDDTDSDGDTLTVSAIRTGAESGSGTSGSVGSALTGTYGTLTLNANGSYSYVADQDAADSISDGATATDTFTYTITDGDKTDTAEIVITVTGTNFVAVNDTDSVNEDATVTATDGSSTDVITDDSGSGTLVVSAIRLGGTEGSGTAGTVGSALTGTYGTLTLNADGSYSYVADQAAADALDANDTATDVFNYTLSNGSSTDTATLTITVTGINDPVVAANDTGSVNEDATLTVSDGSGDIIANNDTDADDSASLVVSAIRIRWN